MRFNIGKDSKGNETTDPFVSFGPDHYDELEGRNNPLEQRSNYGQPRPHSDYGYAPHDPYGHPHNYRIPEYHHHSRTPPSQGMPPPLNSHGVYGGPQAPGHEHYEQLHRQQMAIQNGYQSAYCNRIHPYDANNSDARLQQQGIDPRHIMPPVCQPPADHRQQAVGYHDDRQQAVGYHDGRQQAVDGGYHCTIGYRHGQTGQPADMQRFKHPVAEWRADQMSQHQAMRGYADDKYCDDLRKSKEVKDDTEIDRTKDINNDKYQSDLKQRKRTMMKEDKQKFSSSEESSDISYSDSDDYDKAKLHHSSQINPRDFDTKYPPYAGPFYPYHPYPPGMHIPTPLRHLGPPSPSPSPYHQVCPYASCPPNTPIHMQSPYHPHIDTPHHAHLPIPSHHESPYHMGHMPHVPMPGQYDMPPFAYPALAFAQYPPMNYHGDDIDRRRRHKKRRSRDTISSQSERESKKSRKNKMNEEKNESKNDKMDIEREADNDRSEKKSKKN